MNMRQNIIVLQILMLFFSLQPAFTQINFIEHLIDDNTQGTGSIYATDLDGDQDLDVLAASLEDNQILWFRNDGGNPVNWAKIIVASNVYHAHSVYAADFDMDNDIDIAGAAYYGSPGIAWWRNDGGNPVVWTKFAVAQSFINAHEIYVCDLDKDNDPDILGASSELNSIGWWRNDGGDPVIWSEQILSDNVTLAKSVHVGDFDGDNDNDIVGVSILDNDILWWRNDGGSPISWTEFVVDGHFIGAHCVQAVDMDNDGDDDILGAGYLGHQVAWWRNDGGSPVSWEKQPIASGVLNACIAYAADLDEDDDLDVIATAQGGNEIAWWRNNGNGSTDWTKYIITDNFTRPWPLFAGDLNGDEYIDIISGSSHQGSNEIKWWENNGLVSLDENPFSPKNIKTMNCTPNPFCTKTIISYYSEMETPVTLHIYDILGQLVKIVAEGIKSPGLNSVSWDATDQSGNIVRKGLYFCRLKTERKIIFGKVIYN